MIVDLPTKDELEWNGVAFLNLAWELVIGLSLQLADAQEAHDYGYFGLTVRQMEKQKQLFWEQAQHQISVAIALTQQGAEFLLKSKIADTSPYLLIAGEPNKWPSGCDREHKSFSEFITIDAHELIRVHDTICGDSERLKVEFREEFERLRRLRNTVMHSVDKRRSLAARDGVLAILHVANGLMGPQTWQYMRKDYLGKKVNPSDPDCSSGNPMAALARETQHAITDLGLSKADVRKHFLFDPSNNRKYISLCCSDRDTDFYPLLTQIRPRARGSTSVTCASCCDSFPILRQQCTWSNCKGNVIDEKSGHCLTCGY